MGDLVTRGLNVVVCDDHRVLTDALISYLQDVPEIDSVVATYSADQAVKAVDADVDLILLDLSLDDDEESCDGVNVIEAIRHRGFDVPILLLSGRGDVDTIVHAMRLGANGFCSKDCNPDELVAMVHHVVSGQVALPNHLIEPVFGELRRRRQNAQDQADLLATLTPREQQVLRLLSGGRVSTQIARTLHLSNNTVRTHLQHVMKKLGVHSQLQAAAEGRRLFEDELAS